jgi:methyl-galactoside transport system permease protein
MSLDKNKTAGSADILTDEQAAKLLEPIDSHIGEIQKKIDVLRADGEEKIVLLKNGIQLAKENKALSKGERDSIVSSSEAAIAEAKKVEAANKPEIDSLIKEAEGYLKQHYAPEYQEKVEKSCIAEKQVTLASYERRLSEIDKEHEDNLSKLNSSDANYKQELKDENYVFKNKKFDAKMSCDKQLQAAKDHKHEAFTHEYHLIDLLRRSRFTFSEQQAQKWEAYRYSFNRKQFFLRNGLYIVILLVFVMLCILTPILKHTNLLTVNNVMNIMQQAAPRMFFALGVAGLILLTGTDLSIGRIVGMNMVISTVVMHNGPNTGTVFGKIIDLSSMGAGTRAILALLICILCSVMFTSIAGFFTARFKIHPFVSTMSNMLIIFGLVTYGTKGVSFGAIDTTIPAAFIPQIGAFPTIILWALAAIMIVWFIWNKTRFGKYLYAVGGNPEAASVSGISVFKVTLRAFMIAGVLYAFGAWLECQRMVGSGSAAYGQGWDMDAIAACVVGGVSFTGGIGKISGVVVGVLIFTALTYSLTILGIDTNLQFVFEGIIIIAAVTLDSLKYVQKK